MEQPKPYENNIWLCLQRTSFRSRVWHRCCPHSRWSTKLACHLGSETWGLAASDCTIKTNKRAKDTLGVGAQRSNQVRVLTSDRITRHVSGKKMAQSLPEREASKQR
jgi:hypothetical protein